jgi:hypothetical protein
LKLQCSAATLASSRLFQLVHEIDAAPWQTLYNATDPQKETGNLAGIRSCEHGLETCSASQSMCAVARTLDLKHFEDFRNKAGVLQSLLAKDHQRMGVGERKLCRLQCRPSLLKPHFCKVRPANGIPAGKRIWIVVHQKLNYSGIFPPLVARVNLSSATVKKKWLSSSRARPRVTRSYKPHIRAYLR